MRSLKIVPLSVGAILACGLALTEPTVAAVPQSAGCEQTGRVTSRADGAPVASALVGLIGQETVRTVLTDPLGNFAFHSVAIGKYSVLVKKLGYVDFASEMIEEGHCSSPRRILDVALERSGTISGIIRDHLGVPAPGIEVSIENSRARAVTNGQGEYRFENLAAGRYIISATAPNNAFLRQALSRHEDKEVDRVLGLLAKGIFDPGTVAKGEIKPEALTLLPAYFPGVLHSGEAVPISLQAGESRGGADFSFILERSYTLGGHVTGMDGRPVSGAPVVVGREYGSSFVPIATEYSTGDGGFAVRGLLGGPYLLRAWHAGPWAGRAPDPLVVARSVLEWASVPVTVSNDIAEVQVVLGPALVVNGRLEFQADTSGRPKDLTRMTLSLERPPPVVDALRAITYPATIDNTGTFVVNHLTPGEYTWRCAVPGYAVCEVIRTRIKDMETLGAAFSLIEARAPASVTLVVALRER